MYFLLKIIIITNQLNQTNRFWVGPVHSVICVSPHSVYLLIKLQPGLEAFVVQIPQAKVPDLPQADGPGHLGHREHRSTTIKSFILIRYVTIGQIWALKITVSSVV